ncbi:MAG: VanZ family protein, partial [Peptococcaceae bacterium]
MLGLLYSLLITFVPVVIYRQWMLRKGRVLTKEHRLWSDVFVLYLWMVLLVTGVGSIWDFVEKGGVIASVRAANFSWIPFVHGGMVTTLLN